MSTLYRQRSTSEKLLQDFNTWNLEDIETINSNDFSNMEEIVNYSINGVNFFHIFFETKFEILQIKTYKTIDITEKSPEKGSTVQSISYKRHFDEIQSLGSGGYGKVFKVRHKISSQFYAIKKVHFSGK